MNWLSEFEGWVERDVPLADLTWFGLGGRARYMAHPTDAGRLGGLLRRAVEAEVPVKVLGGGANVLVSDSGFDGLVIRLDDPLFSGFRIEGERVIADGGADLMGLVGDCCRMGLAGLECLAGVPGTVGGAIRMNAGGRHGEIADVVESVEVVEACGRQRVLTPDEVGFGYRRTALSDSVVTGARLRLHNEDPKTVYHRFKDIWRSKKHSQPMADQSAGCVFTNPPGESAGRLIDRAGLKGSRVGQARVSPTHANFIVADKGAAATDVLRLIDRIRQTVRRRFGTELELEIDIW